MSRDKKLRLASLEDRVVPANFGNQWVDARHLTLSFVPDSTAVDPGTSNLFSKMDASYSREVWQGALLRAYQTWAVEANIDIGVVSDSGATIGAVGAIQGDRRFGDIRIAGSAMDATVLALTSPYDPFAGTRSGDFVINTAKDFGTAGYDLFSVALHEAGHSLGVAHSDDIASVMYENYRGVRTGLSAGDIASIQALYGTRVADPLPANGAVRTIKVDGLSTAAPVLSSGQRQAAESDITSTGEADTFSVRTSASMGPLVVRMQTAGLSMLRGHLTVSDSAGTVLFDESASESGGDLKFEIAHPRGTYAIRVSGADAGLFGVGGYRLSVQKANFVAPPVAESTERGSNDTIGHANNLGIGHSGKDRRYDFAVTGSISESTDRDFFKIRSAADLGGRNTLIVSTWAMDGAALDPQLAVFDAAGKRMETEILVHQDGSTTIQLRNVKAETVYFVRVTSIDAHEASQKGRYFLGINFSGHENVLDTVAARTGGFGQHGDLAQFTAIEPQVYHFVFSARTVLNLNSERIGIVVLDAAHNVLGSRVIRAGDTASFDLHLASGNYTFAVVNYAGNRVSDLPFTWQLKYTGITDPIGIEPTDGLSPAGGGGGGGSGYVGPVFPPSPGPGPANPGGLPPVPGPDPMNPANPGGLPPVPGPGPVDPGNPGGLPPVPDPGNPGGLPPVPGPGNPGELPPVPGPDPINPANPGGLPTFILPINVPVPPNPDGPGPLNPVNMGNGPSPIEPNWNGPIDPAWWLQFLGPLDPYGNPWGF